jgi:uncharacterized protein involved in response to NO
MTDTMLDSDAHQVSPPPRFALFNYGFRPFFLLAGAYALLMAPLWVWIYAHGVAVVGSAPSMYWHAHEMLFGFVSAAIAGFLLTAVPSWTGEKGFGGRPLIALTILWLGGRVAMAGFVPFWIAAALELSFLPALATLLAPPLIRARNRNTPLLAVIGALWLLDGAFVLSLRKSDVALSATAMQLAIDFVMVLVTLIGGRIVPSFTANALRRRGETAQIASRAWVESAVVTLMIAIAVVDIAWPTSALSGVLAAAAALMHLVRLSGWRSFKTRGEAILWILHVGYA